MTHGGNKGTPCEDMVQQVPEQCGGAGSSPHQTMASVDVGFKRFDTATITISGIELAEKIRKQRFKIESVLGRPVSTPDIWAAVLAA